MLDRRRFLLSSATIAATFRFPANIEEARVVTESKDYLLPASYLASFDELSAPTRKKEVLCLSLQAKKAMVL